MALDPKLLSVSPHLKIAHLVCHIPPVVLKKNNGIFFYSLINNGAFIIEQVIDISLHIICKICHTSFLKLLSFLHYHLR